MLPELFVTIILLAFALEFFDASVGMGYGTTLIPVLLLLGFAPLHAIPAVLLTNAVVGILAGVIHHKFENVSFKRKSEDLKIMLVLTSFGILGILIAALVAVRLSEFILKAYIGLLVLVVGAVILLKHKRKRPFSWNKLISLGFLASFNKGISGGGYGPVVVGGQILSGVKSRKAVGIALLAEGLISIVGVIAYRAINTLVQFDMALVAALLVGALPSVPLAAYVVKKFHPKRLRFTVGLASIILGTAILSKLFL
jgi:uncharacterized membrane protein YfcA